MNESLPVDAAQIDSAAKNFNHHSPEFRQCPFAIYDHMRETAPVAHTDAWGGYWVLTRYEDVKKVAQDDVNFSAAANGITLPPGQYPSIPISLDPPESTQIKRLLTPHLSPQAMSQWTADIAPLTAQFIDEFIETGHCDFTPDLGMPLTGIITMRLSGIDDSKWRHYAEMVHKVIYMDGTVEDFHNYNRIIWEGCLAEVESQRQKPRPGIISALLKAELNGHPVPTETVAGILNLLLFGGLDTTQAVLGCALVHLARHPEMKQHLIAHPELMPTAVEEFLRLYSPQQGLFRTAMNDIEIGGTAIKAGDKVMMCWGAANRDADMFSCPADFDPAREPNRHLAFGVGSHRCLGSTLARAEIQICLEAILARLPDYTVDESQLMLAPSVGTVYGYKTIPLRFTPGKRLSN